MAALPGIGDPGIITFLLVLSRISGLFLIAPVFSSRMVPVRAKLLIALALALALTPLELGRVVPTDVVAVLALVLKEVLVGFAIGFAVAAVFASVQAAGTILDLTVGFSFANVVDPMQNAQISVIGQLYGLLASAVFLAINGHGILLAGFARSFDVVAVNAYPDFDDLVGGTIAATAGLFGAALALAAPVLVTLMVTDVAVGFLARVAPQMNIFGIELPAKVGALFLLLVVTAPFLVGSIGDRIEGGLMDVVRWIAGIG